MKRGVFGMVTAVLVALALLMGPGTVAAKEIKAGFIYVSPVGDAGWSKAHDDGRKAIEALDGVETTFVESVSIR